MQIDRRGPRSRCAPSAPLSRRRVLPVPRPPTRAEDAEAAFAATGPVIDVQTHLIDPARWHGDGYALTGFLHVVDPDRWPDAVDPRVIDGAAWAALVFGSGETVNGVTHIDPGRRPRNVLLNPPDRDHPRARRPLRGHGARAHARHRPTPTPAGRVSSAPWRAWPSRSAVGMEVLHAVRPADRRRPPADGSSTTTRSGCRSSSACAPSAPGGAVHKGSVARSPTRRSRPRRRATSVRPRRVPRHHVRRVPLGLRARPRR